MPVDQQTSRLEEHAFRSLRRQALRAVYDNPEHSRHVKLLLRLIGLPRRLRLPSDPVSVAACCALVLVIGLALGSVLTHSDHSHAPGQAPQAPAFFCVPLLPATFT